jgi:hypothetical protein
MNVRRRSWLFGVVLSSLVLCGAPRAGARASGAGERTIEGMVYYTNDSPKDYRFSVELFDAKRRRIAARWTAGQTGRFEFKRLKPAKYYLQVVASARCVLQYEVDATRAQPESLRVFGDADCGRAKVAGLPAPRPVPRDQER